MDRLFKTRTFNRWCTAELTDLELKKVLRTGELLEIHYEEAQ